MRSTLIETSTTAPVMKTAAAMIAIASSAERQPRARLSAASPSE
jgi:hypothetical protein